MLLKIISLENILYQQVACYSRYTSRQIRHVIINNRLANPLILLMRTKKDVIIGPNDPDTFGTLSRHWESNKVLESMPDEDGDVTEINYLDGIEGKTRLRTKQYADMIKNLVQEKKISEALDVLEIKMLKEDKAQPENYIYNLLIGICASVGYTKKAFQLFNKMKSRGLKVTGGTYTSLFNACSNSPWKSDGLERAKQLLELIKEKGYIPNQSNYHSMLKAFGRCGDLTTAFSLVDEMLSNKVPVSSETINFLLQACISDREAGFRHALLVWRRMVDRRIRPSIYTYNLILRCVRDCGLGDVETLNNDIEHIGRSKIESNLLLSEKSDSILIENRTIKVPLAMPNLLAIQPNMGSVVKVKHITKPKHRLMLLGSCEGFLKQMSVDKVKPDIKTVTQLLEVLPSTLEAETHLLTEIKKHGIQLDISFCNMLIKKRNKRDARIEAKEVLKLISSYQLNPDIVTFGVLAMGCRGSAEINQLLRDIENSGYRVNIEILGTLLRSAIRSWDVRIILQLMDMVLKKDIHPNMHFIKHLQEFHDYVQAQLKIKESGGHAHKKMKDTFFLESFKRFCYRYKQWKNLVEVHDPDKVHPWEQFKQMKEA